MGVNLIALASNARKFCDTAPTFAEGMNEKLIEYASEVDKCLEEVKELQLRSKVRDV